MTIRISSALSRRKVMVALGATAGLGYLGPRIGGAAGPVRGPVTALVFDRGGLLLAADGFWTSADGGANWDLAMDRPYSGGVEHDVLGPAPAAPRLAVDPKDPNHFVAAASGGTILTSRDGGLTRAAPAAA